jgi:hypothetical protein
MNSRFREQERSEKPWVVQEEEHELALREVMNRITVMLDSDKIELYTCSSQIKIKQRPRDLTVLHIFIILRDKNLLHLLHLKNLSIP